MHFSLLFSLLFSGVLTSQARVYEDGTLYSKKNPQQALFKYKVTEEVLEIFPPMTVRRGVYTDMQGNILVTEESRYQKGKLLSLEIEHKQRQEKWTATVKDGRVYFENKDKKGKVKKDDIKLKPNFVTRANLKDYLFQRWKQLMNGETVKMRYAVLLRQETFGFKVKKDREEVINGEKMLVFRMKPTNFLIAQFVDPIYFYVRVRDSIVTKTIGLALPLVQRKGEWEEIETITVFEEIPTRPAP